jgi:hypothetical protein
MVGQPWFEPIVTEPIENHIGVKPAPAIAITESPSNAKLPSYASSTESAGISANRHAIVHFVQSISSFTKTGASNAVISKMSRVNSSKNLASGKRKIRVPYEPSSPRDRDTEFDLHRWDNHSRCASPRVPHAAFRNNGDEIRVLWWQRYNSGVNHALRQSCDAAVDPSLRLSRIIRSIFRSGA